MSQGVGCSNCLPKAAWPPTYENLNEIMNVATQLREELRDNDYLNTSHILNETYNLNAESQDLLSYINEQISHIKEMLFNLNDIVGVNTN